MASSFVSNQGTQTPILVDTTGGTAGTLIAVQKVDISGAGTAGTFWNGGVTGTINSGTISQVGTNLGMGTLSNVGSITNIGTIGTIAGMNSGTYQNISTGTLQTL